MECIVILLALAVISLLPRSTRGHCGAGIEPTTPKPFPERRTTTPDPISAGQIPR